MNSQRINAVGVAGKGVHQFLLADPILPHGVVGGASEDKFALGDEPQNILLEAADLLALLLVFDFPKVNFFIAPGGADAFAVRGEPDSNHRRGMIDIGCFQIAGPAVENARRTVAAGGGDLRAVAMEGDGGHPIGMLLDEPLLFAGRDIVNADGIVGTGGSDPLAVGRDVISTLRDSSIIIRRNCGEVRSGFFWRYLPWPIPPRSNLNKSRANACNRPKATSCSLCNFSWSVN